MQIEKLNKFLDFALELNRKVTVIQVIVGALGIIQNLEKR